MHIFKGYSNQIVQQRIDSLPMQAPRAAPALAAWLAFCDALRYD